MQDIAKFLEQRFPGDGHSAAFRNEILRVCIAFKDSGLADPKFAIELTCGSDSKLWSCVSEALVFDRLCDKQFVPRSGTGAGPDFLLRDGNRRIWVEIICPQPVGIPAHWTEIQTNTVGNVPHNAILLRWTSAIKEKTEKLVGGAGGMSAGYLQSGIVSKDDIYVIAVNGCQLRHGPFPSLHGISQFPYAVEAVFPVGPQQLRIDRETLECVGHGYQERFEINKPNGALVPSYAFLDPRYKMISAIWAMDFNGSTVVGGHEPSALIHNPNAVNPLSRGFLPCNEEFVATPSGEDEYSLERTLIQAKNDC